MVAQDKDMNLKLYQPSMAREITTYKTVKAEGHKKIFKVMNSNVYFIRRFCHLVPDLAGNAVNGDKLH